MDTTKQHNMETVMNVIAAWIPSMSTDYHVPHRGSLGKDDED